VHTDDSFAQDLAQAPQVRVRRRIARAPNLGLVEVRRKPCARDQQAFVEGLRVHRLELLGDLLLKVRYPPIDGERKAEVVQNIRRGEQLCFFGSFFSLVCGSLRGAQMLAVKALAFDEANGQKVSATSAPTCFARLQIKSAAALSVLAHSSMAEASLSSLSSPVSVRNIGTTTFSAGRPKKIVQLRLEERVSLHSRRNLREHACARSPSVLVQRLY
jgi:hypothetical protein